MTLQEVQRAPQVGRPLTGPKSDDPADRYRRQPGRQGAERRRRAAVGPLEVIEAYQEGRIECGALQERFEILKQPISLLGRGVCVAQCGPFEDRWRALQEGLEQHGQLDDGVGWVGHTASDSYRQAAGHRRRLLEEAALAHPRAPLDQHHRPYAREELVEVPAQDGQFGVAATNLVRTTLWRTNQRPCH